MANNGWNVTVPLSSLGAVGTALSISAIIFKMGCEVVNYHGSQYHADNHSVLVCTNTAIYRCTQYLCIPSRVHNTRLIKN